MYLAFHILNSSLLYFNMSEDFQSRIGFKGNIDIVLRIVCKDFSLGEFVSSKIIEVGYEDFNLVMQTSTGKYFVKFFTASRSLSECKRYIQIMQKALQAGVKFPKLFKSNQGYLHKIKIQGQNLRLCIMEFVDGDNFFNLGLSVTPKEVKFLARQAALINSIDLKPSFILDEWAIVNFVKEFKEKGKYLSAPDFALVKPVLAEYNSLDIKKLPWCFVHGDLLKTNLMKDKKGKVWIIDFAVSNYYPRIVELAVLAGNLLFDEHNKTHTEENFKIALSEYQKRIPLTKVELEALPVFIKTQHAIHILLPNFHKKIKKNNSKENHYWLEQGRLGLRQMLE